MTKDVKAVQCFPMIELDSSIKVIQPTDRQLLQCLAEKYGFQLDEERAAFSRTVQRIGDSALAEIQDGVRITLDAEDVERVIEKHWTVRERATPCGSLPEVLATGDRASLARFLVCCDDHTIVTFKNGNMFDFRKANLIAVDKRRPRKSPGKTSRYLGVSRIKTTGRWVANICKGNRRNTHLGVFSTEKAAAAAYDGAAREAFGDAARLNFPADGEREAIMFEAKAVA